MNRRLWESNAAVFFFSADALPEQLAYFVLVVRPQIDALFKTDNIKFAVRNQSNQIFVEPGSAPYLCSVSS